LLAQRGASGGGCDFRGAGLGFGSFHVGPGRLKDLPRDVLLVLVQRLDTLQFRFALPEFCLCRL
jgi:hypothetical protein